MPPVWTNPFRMVDGGCPHNGEHRVTIDISAPARDAAITSFAVNNQCTRSCEFTFTANGITRTETVAGGLNKSFAAGVLRAVFGRDITFQECDWEGPRFP